MNLRFVYKELKHRPNRALINVLGICIGVALFISISAISTAYQKAARQPFKEVGADLIIQRGQNKSLTDRPTQSMHGIRLPFSNQLFEKADIDTIHKIQGVDAVAGTLLLWEFSHHGFKTILGVDTGQPAIGAVKMKGWVHGGRFPENSAEIALEKHFARFQKKSVNDRFQLNGHEFIISGIINIKEGAQMAAANIYMPLKSAQMLLAENLKKQETIDLVNQIYVKLNDPALLNPVKSQITQQITHASISSSDAVLEMMGGVLIVSKKLSLTASLVGLMGAVLLIMKTMTANLIERSREIGILKAVGWTQADIQKQLAIEALVQTIAGGILGILLGYAISFTFGFFPVTLPVPWDPGLVPAMAKHTQTASQVVKLPVSISWSLSAAALGLSVLLGCGIGYMTARQTSKMKPADIFRQI